MARLVDLIKTSRHVVVCTGAGISTNAGIRDYRGPNGIWTEAQAMGVVSGEPGDKKSKVMETPWDEAMYRLLPQATPTIAHRVITQMATSAPPLDGGVVPLVKHVISQNEDGLHLRSGLPPEQLSEVHGNAFIELCGKYEDSDSDSDLSGSSSGSDSDDGGSSSSSSSSSSDSEVARIEEATKIAKAEARKLRPPGCGMAVVRGFVTYHGETYRRSNPAGRHVTRRACPNCRPPDAPLSECDGPLTGIGWLHDSTVDFGESPGGFPWGANTIHNMQSAKLHMQHADLVLVLGSSLSILANYFCPWRPESKWAKPPPAGLRLAPPPGEASAADGKKRKGKALTSRCRLAIVNKGTALDEELAAIKIEADVDAVCEELRKQLGYPPPPPYIAEEDPLRKRVLVPREGEPRSEWNF